MKDPIRATEAEMDNAGVRFVLNGETIVRQRAAVLTTAALRFEGSSVTNA